jgi:hypothetical protein
MMTLWVGISSQLFEDPYIHLWAPFKPLTFSALQLLWHLVEGSNHAADRQETAF